MTPVEVCYTGAQVRAVKICIFAMVGMSIFQARTISKLVKDLNHGREQFEKLHGASMYLFEVLEKNNVELSEFDEIAIAALVSEPSVKEN